MLVLKKHGKIDKMFHRNIWLSKSGKLEHFIKTKQNNLFSIMTQLYTKMTNILE
jgi:hypothetical protein